MEIEVVRFYVGSGDGGYGFYFLLRLESFRGRI